MEFTRKMHPQWILPRRGQEDEAREDVKEVKEKKKTERNSLKFERWRKNCGDFQKAFMTFYLACSLCRISGKE